MQLAETQRYQVYASSEVYLANPTQPLIEAEDVLTYVTLEEELAAIATDAEEEETNTDSTSEEPSLNDSEADAGAEEADTNETEEESETTETITDETNEEDEQSALSAIGKSVFMLVADEDSQYTREQSEYIERFDTGRSFKIYYFDIINLLISSTFWSLNIRNII